MERMAVDSVTRLFDTVSTIGLGRMADIEAVVSGIVDGGTVIGGIVLPGIVVVYVKVTCPPRALAGIAVPTPDAVNCVGIGRVPRSGFAAGLSEYMLPLFPSINVYSPVSRFAVSPPEEVY